MDTVSIKFSNKSAPAFISDLKKQVNSYFEENNLSRKANGAMIMKTVAMLLLTFGPYALIMSNQFSIWTMWLLAFIMGVGVAGIGFSVSHDALHGAYSSNNRVNTALGLTFDLLGANGYLWKITHNVIHHTYTNIQGIDEDLEVSPLLRLSPESEHKPIHRYQHFYGLAAYSFSTLFWVFVKDYKYLLQRDLGPYRDIKHDKGQIVLLIAMKIVYYAYMIVLPLMFLNVAWWQYIIGFLTIHLTAGLILGVVFQLAHVVEGPGMEQITSALFCSLQFRLVYLLYTSVDDQSLSISDSISLMTWSRAMSIRELLPDLSAGLTSFDFINDGLQSLWHRASTACRSLTAPSRRKSTSLAHWSLRP